MRLQAASEDPSSCFVIVSSDSAAAPVLSTLRTLGRTVLAVTASHEADGPEATATPAVPHSTARLHLSLTGGARLRTPAPRTPLPPFSHPTTVTTVVSEPPAESEPADAAPTAASSVTPETAGSADNAAGDLNGHLPASPAPAQQAPAQAAREIPNLPPEHQGALDAFVRLDVADKWALLSSRLKLMSGDIFSQLKGRMRADEAAYCGFAGFPKSLIKSRTFKHSLVAGLSAQSTWSQMAQLAVLLMLRKFDSRDLNAQLGLLAIVRIRSKCSPSCWVGIMNCWNANPTTFPRQACNVERGWHPTAPQHAVPSFHEPHVHLVPGANTRFIVSH